MYLLHSTATLGLLLFHKMIFALLWLGNKSKR